MIRPKISELKEKKDVGALVKAVGAVGLDYRMEAVKALCEIGDQNTVKPLLDAFKKLDAEEEKIQVIEDIILALTRIGSLHIEPILELLESNDSTAKDMAVVVLIEIVDERAIEPLIKNLDDADEFRKWRIIQALTKIGEKSVESLIKALDNKDRKIQKCVAEALFKIGNEQAIDAIKNVEFYDDLKNSTTKKLAPHFKKRDIYFPDKCVYCGNPKEDIITREIRADIIKDNERVKIHLPYCKKHIQEGRKNKAILYGLYFAFFLTPWFLIIYYFCYQMKPNAVYALLTIFLIGPLVSFGILFLMKYLLSRKITSLKNISLGYFFSGADVGITWEKKGALIEFEFQNKDIASEFDRNMANI
jgi:hypothetical protein